MNTIDMKSTVMNGIAAIEGLDPLDHAKRAKWMNTSEAGSCIRGQWYRKFAPEKATEDDRGFARRGHHMEKYMVDAVRAGNAPLVQAGDEQLTWTDRERKLSGTPDGVLVYDNEWVPVDFKSVDPRTNVAKNLPRKEHVLQVQIAMHCITLGLVSLMDKTLPINCELLPIKRGLLVYMDASNYDNIYQFEIKPLQIEELNRLEKRAKKLLRTKKVGLLDREGKAAGGRECRTCPFKEACDVTAAEVEYKGGRGRSNRGSKLADTAVLYVEHKELEAKTKDAIAELAETIKVELANRKLRQTTVAGIDITLQAVAGRKSLDRKAMEKDKIDLPKYETIGRPRERLVVARTPEG